MNAVLISGGPDSITLTHSLHHEGKKIFGIFIDYGHPASEKEYLSARYVSEKLSFELFKVDLLGMYQSFINAGLTRNDMLMAGCGDPYAQVLTAAQFASAKGANSISLGIHLDDVTRHPGTLAVLEAQEKAIHAVLSGKKFPTFSYEYPFAKIPKSEVLSIGMRLGVAYEHTWSCYEVGEFHCGECQGCKSRKAAFEVLSQGDPTHYAS